MSLKTINELVLISGKGGTGKTTLAAAIAHAASGDAVVADCDVDAANLHLLLKPICYGKEDFFGGERATIELSRCIACNRCKEICRFNAIENNKDKYFVHPYKCEGCGYCALICPTDAIELSPAKNGKVFYSHINTGSQMVHAKMEVGGENSGKLVTKVKRKANTIANELECSYIIVDGSPGIGCPVVASVSGAKGVLLVTEPSLSAFHDLKRVMNVVRRFGALPMIIINKYNINGAITDEIIEYARENKIIFLAKIPYDPMFFRDRDYFDHLWKRIKTIIN